MGNKQNTVTNEMIEDLFRNSKTRVETVDGKCTVVTVTLENGFMLTESAACVDKENYDEYIGREICLKKIKEKLWELEGYKLQCELYQKEIHPHAVELETPRMRVEKELKDLDGKIVKLERAMWGSGLEFNVAEEHLLREQLDAMVKYANILRARLSIWRDEIPKAETKEVCNSLQQAGE